ncbi:MAG: EAL domain-containing protein [Rubrivivax sp.]
MSLRSRLTAIALASMVFVVAVVVAISSRQFQHRYEAALQSRALAVGNGLRTQLDRLLHLGLPLAQLTGFDEQCREVVHGFAGIESAYVVDAGARVLFHSGGAAQPSAAEQQALRAALADGAESVRHVGAAASGSASGSASGPGSGSGGSLLAVLPVRDDAGTLVGGVVIGVDGEHVHNELGAVLRSAVLAGLLALAAGALLLWVALRAFVTRPVEALVQTIVGLRERPGDLGRRVAVTSTDELGQLGRAFNGLMDELRQQSDALFEQKERAEVTLRSIADGVIATDALDRVRYLNPVAEQLTGWSGEAAIGRPVHEVLRLVDARLGSDVPLSTAALAGDGVLPDEFDLVRADGARIGVDHRAALMHDRLGSLTGAVLTFRDISLERGFVRQRTWEAAHDVLTGLVNRREFEARLHAAVQVARSDGTGHVVCFMDLDRFKVVNDTCGHAAGDELLKAVTASLRQRVRQGDTLARFGGDEFALLMDGCTLAHAEQVANGLVAAVRDFRFAWQGRTLRVGLSIGLAAVHGDTTAAEALSRADSACYWAKEQGRDRACVYDHADHQMAARRHESGWVARIEAALAEDRFVLYQQRYLGLTADARRRPHLEVLLRLREEDGRLVPPDQFLPAAERYHLMPAVDRWVIGKVFAGYHGLVQRLGVPALTCAINLSGTSLNVPGLAEHVRECARAHALPSGAVCFEITETAALRNLGQAAGFIEECRRLGFQFALDDFGTGNSSLGYLKNLPVDYLKIDGGFVRNIVRDRVDRALTETINHLGHMLGIHTVAECAEDAAIIDELRRIGVDYAQGHGVEAPTPLFPEPASMAAAARPPPRAAEVGAT